MVLHNTKLNIQRLYKDNSVKAFVGNLAQSRLKWHILTSIPTQRMAHLLTVECAVVWMLQSQCQQRLLRIVYLPSNDDNAEELRLKRRKRNEELREKKRKESRNVKQRGLKHQTISSV